MGIFELIRWILEQFEQYIMPFQLIHVWEKGVLFTLGKNPKLLGPGLRFKFPFVQQIYTENVMLNTMCPKAIHATTTDGKTVSIEPAIEYEITDPIAWICEVNEATSNLHDITRSVVSDYVTDATWEDVKKKASNTEIRKKLNNKVKGMGCKVTDVMLTNMCISRVIITQI